MRTLIMLGVVAVAALAGASRLAAQDKSWVVVVNEGNYLTGISTDELNRIYTKKTVRWTDGQAIVPVDLTEDAPVREIFTQAVLRKTVNAVKAYWQSLIFSGRGVPPVQFASEQAVLSYVRSTPGAIAYVSTETNVGPGIRKVHLQN
jgi:ABC-type phosphate transport system substrate-binding protein